MAENLLELISKSGKITTLQDKYFKRWFYVYIPAKKENLKNLVICYHIKT